MHDPGAELLHAGRTADPRRRRGGARRGRQPAARADRESAAPSPRGPEEPPGPAGITRATAWLSFRFARLRPVLEGGRTLLIADGGPEGRSLRVVEAEAVPAPDRALPERVIAVAASAGGVEAIRRVVSSFPAGFPAAVCVTLHIPATGRSLLAPILDREGALTAVVAEDGMALRPGVIYVAPADRHLLIGREALQLGRDPKENGARPAADPMFRSLASTWGSRAIAVVLSGALDDGSAGAVAVADAGGTVVVQEPRDALVPSMPASAIAANSPEHVVPVAEIAGVLCELVGEAVPDPKDRPVQPDPLASRPDGPASSFTSPECSGALWELREGELVRYRCRVGHG